MSLFILFVSFYAFYIYIYIIWSLKGFHPLSIFKEKTPPRNNQQLWVCPMKEVIYYVQHFLGKEYFCNLFVSCLKQANKQKARMAWQEFYELCQPQLVLYLLLRSISSKFLCIWTWVHSLIQSKYNFTYTDLVALWDSLVAFLSSLSRWNYLLSCTKSC